MKKFLLFSSLLLGIFFPGHCLANDLSSVHMLGIRFGFWNAVEAQNIKGSPDQEISSKVTAPYGEFFVSSGLKKGFALEFSFGSCYRGETRYSDPYGYYWKQVNIYPISAELKFYPLFPIKKSRWQPYADAGVAFVSGIEDLRFGEYAGPLLLVGSGTNTYTTLGWHTGGGIEFVLSRLFVIGADFKYRGVNFNETVGGLKDYSGPQVTVGLSYILKGI
jgi:hypothetical protein